MPSVDESLYGVRPVRPLGRLSSFACEQIGHLYDGFLAGRITAADAFDAAEAAAKTVSPAIVADLVKKPTTEQARVARLDVAFIERLLSVIHGGSAEYRARREHSTFFPIGRALSRSQLQLPFLQWSDIGATHPPLDPRTFLAPGAGRDQEVLLYRIQGGIERVYRKILQEWPVETPDSHLLNGILEDLDAVVGAMAHLSRVRTVGEFEKLDTFLSPNGEVIGHATGSFSAWTMVAGYMLTGEEFRLDRVRAATNRMAFDSDVRYWIDWIDAGCFAPLPALIASQHVPEAVPALVSAAGRRYADFHKVHRGAVKKHASSTLGCPAPASPTITNGEAFDLAARHTPMDRRPPAGCSAGTTHG